jgi:2'-5' RNA ligase
VSQEQGEPIRAFVALGLPIAVKDALAAAQAAMRRRAERGRLHPRFIQPTALHVTLKFVGWIDPDKVGQLSEALDVASDPPIETRLLRLVAFGSARRARIVAAELDDPQGRIAGLAEHFEARAEELGIARETRPFRPHVTLIRIKRPGDVGDWLEAAELAPVEAALDEVVLYQSILHPTGSEYRPLLTVRLGSGATTSFRC